MVFVSKCIRKYVGDLSETACSIWTGSTTTASDQYCIAMQGSAPHGEKGPVVQRGQVVISGADARLTKNLQKVTLQNRTG